MNFEPTDEQRLVKEAARTTKDNIIIHALAGAAKTSTLILIARACMVPILSVAFNVRIAKEMADRMPGNVTSRTLNGVGHRAWGRARGGNCIVDKDKGYNIMKGLIDGLSGEDKSHAYEQLSVIRETISWGKTGGYVPKAFADMAKPLLTEEDLFASMDEEPTPVMMDLIIEASTISMRQAFDRQIDYDDQILMPSVFPAVFDKFPLTLLDESQDFSELNHVMLRKMIGENRVIAVGDEFQSIYGFRGAHENSMNLLREEFNMKRFELTTCFRCPQLVVKEARFRAPQMNWAPTAEEGTVRHLAFWDIKEMPLDATILCRNNAPLFKMAMTLLKHGRYPELVGADIGKALIKTMKKFGDETMPVDQAMNALDNWRESKLAKTRDPGKIHDQYECMALFLEETIATTLGGAIAYAERLMTTAGGIKLMTIHKSKGLEFDNVYLLDRHLINLARGQDRNLLYVAMTRAKKNLTYLTTEGFKG